MTFLLEKSHTISVSAGSSEGVWRLLDEPHQQAVLQYGATGEPRLIQAVRVKLLWLSRYSVHVNGGFMSPQGDDPPGPNIDLDKKMDVDKRCMGLNDYNSDMRKGGRGGGMNAYRPGVSKEVAPGDGGSYYDKVAPHRHSTVLCVSCLLRQFHFVFSHCSLFPRRLSSLVFLLPPHHHSNWSAIGCRCDRPCL